MKQVVVLSGKGGTGKTSVTAAFATLATAPVLVDCDVDAADLHLVLDPSVLETHDFSCGKTARLIEEKCLGCGICAELCRYDAVTRVDGVETTEYRIDSIACEGCGVCAEFCPRDAIVMEEAVNGQWFRSQTRVGPMLHARLGVGEENSGKLVALIRQKAREVACSCGAELILIDGPPGIGCPVIASLSGADRMVVVTEPTVAGIHDLKRVAKLAAHFKIAVSIIINKFDVNRDKSSQISRFAMEHGIEVLGEVPYDPVVTQAQIAGRSVVEHADCAVTDVLRGAWNRLSKAIGR